jgi:hypothetical protein
MYIFTALCLPHLTDKVLPLLQEDPQTSNVFYVQASV